tara:strand:+ start:549 stop:1088 length:540 start_codon:yes stop_codon:yes gene_type:complete
MKATYKSRRKLIHTRKIESNGYLREDNFWDIEAILIDTKSYESNNSFKGKIKSGEPIHHMKIIVTLDQSMIIKDIEAKTNSAPYPVCPQVTTNFQSLKGIQIAPGWKKNIRKLLGGTKGCTHLVELLNTIATTAFQTIYPYSKKIETEIKTKPILLNKCYAYSEKSPIVKKLFPNYYKP